MNQENINLIEAMIQKSLQIIQRSEKRILKHIFLFLVITLPVVLLLQSCTTGNPDFYKKVLNDFDTSSYYVALNLKSPYYKGRVLIENDDLYSFLNKTKGWDKSRYLSKMERILLHRRYLRTDEKDILKWKFIKVKQVSSVIYSANKGANSFLAKYFDGVVMNPGLTYEEVYAVISQLFYWGIPMRIDPVSHQWLLDN